MSKHYKIKMKKKKKIGFLVDCHVVEKKKLEIKLNMIVKLIYTTEFYNIETIKKKKKRHYTLVDE